MVREGFLNKNKRNRDEIDEQAQDRCRQGLKKAEIKTKGQSSAKKSQREGE